jgi:hypothetical protein
MRAASGFFAASGTGHDFLHPLLCRLGLIADIVHRIKFTISRPVTPIVDNIVAKIGVNHSLETHIATLVMRKKIVVPGHPAASGNGGVSRHNPLSRSNQIAEERRVMHMNG